MKTFFFVFIKNYYKQKEGLGMGLPLVLLCPIIVCLTLKLLILTNDDCPLELMTVFHKRYTDDNFSLFKH